MKKFIVETYYTCTFKTVHTLDDLNDKELSKIDQRTDGNVEVIEVKLNNRKTKKIGDKYYKFGTKINENAYENKGIIRYFYDSEILTNVLSKNFEILELEADEHKNLDQTVSVWWKILVKKKN